MRDQELLKIIGKRMRESRELAGYSQIKAASLIGYKNSSRLNKIECATDVSSIPIQIIIKAATVYDVSADYLLGLSDDWERDSRVAQCRDISKFLMVAWDSARVKEVNAMRKMNNRLDVLCMALATYEKSSRDCEAAVRRFSELNDNFYDMPGGSLITNSVSRAADAVASASSILRRFRADSALYGDANAMQADCF